MAKSTPQFDSLSPHIDRDMLNRFITDHYERVVRQARRNLGGFPQTSFDAEDVAVSAFRSLMKHVATDDDGQLRDRTELVRLLFTIARKKAAGAVRSESALKRGRSKRTSLSEFDPVDQTAGPDHVAILRDLFGTLLGTLDDDLRDVAELKIQGHTNVEIAAALDVALRTVERRLGSIRELCLLTFT